MLRTGKVSLIKFLLYLQVTTKSVKFMYCKNFHMYGVMIVDMYSTVVFPSQSMINASRVFKHTCIHTMGSHTLTTKYCSYLVCNYDDLLQPAVCFNIIIHTNIIEATVLKSNVTGRCNILFKFQSIHQQLSEIIFLLQITHSFIVLPIVYNTTKKHKLLVVRAYVNVSFHIYCQVVEEGVQLESQLVLYVFLLLASWQY